MEKLNKARILFDSILNLGSSNDDEKDSQIQKILDENSYKEILNIIIELCDECKNPMAYYYIGTANYLKGSKFRDDALKSYNYFLTEKESVSFEFSKEDLGIVYRNIGELYEKKYMYIESLGNYEKFQNLLPDFPSSYSSIAGIYYKMGQVEKSIHTLEMAKETKYYKDKGDITFYSVVDRYLEMYKDYLKNNKVYKPRKRNWGIFVFQPFKYRLFYGGSRTGSGMAFLLFVIKRV